MGTVTGVMLALISTKKQGNVTVSLSYSVCFIQLSLWLLRYLHWILILKYNIMGHAPHYHIKSRLRVLTLISKNGQAQLPCLLEINLHFKIEYFDFFLFAPGIFHSRTSSLSNGTKHQALKMGKKCNNTWDKIQHNTSIQFRYWLSSKGKP